MTKFIFTTQIDVERFCKLLDESDDVRPAIERVSLSIRKKRDGEKDDFVIVFRVNETEIEL